MRKQKKALHKFFSSLLAVCIVATVMPLHAFAVEVDNVLYPICGGFLRLNQFTGTLIDSSNLSGDLVIPSTIEGIQVTAIADRAFYGCENLTSVTVAPTVRTIGDQAFYGCSAMNSVTVPASVQTIGDQAFTSCVSLKTVNLEEGLTYLGKNAFRYCYSLKSISLPSTLTSIESYSFDRCIALESINIPSGVGKIGNNAFSDCNHLTSISIPSTVTSIGEYCLSGCTALKNVTLPAAASTLPTALFNGCTSLERLVVPNGVQRIGELVFRGCTGLRQLSLPDSIQSIAGNSFDGCGDVTFYVNAGSLAQAFAAANGIPFVLGTLDSNTSGSSDVYPDTPFTDVKGHWAESAIKWAYANQYLNGISSTQFGVNISMNRGMLVTVLYNMEGNPDAGVSSFSDVPETAYYAKAVAWAESTEVVGGVGNGKFLPTQNITREQLATMLYNYAKYKNKDLSATGDLTQFKDNDQISNYAGAFVSWAVGSGLLNGMGNGQLSPKGNATRAQAAVMLQTFSSLK